MITLFSEGLICWGQKCFRWVPMKFINSGGYDLSAESKSKMSDQFRYASSLSVDGKCPVLFSDWSLKGLFRIPSKLVKSGAKCVQVESKYSAPFRHALGFAVNCKYAICSCIVTLFLSCFPATVFGFVVPVIVNSTNSHSGIRMPHVSKEVFELQPPITNNDPPSAVIIERFVFRVLTSGDHVCPCSIDSWPDSFRHVLSLGRKA